MNRGGFSWKRLSGLSGAKSRVSRTTGVPFTKSGRQRKVGRIVTGGGCLLPGVLLVCVIVTLLSLVVAGCGSSGPQASSSLTPSSVTSLPPADTAPPTTTASGASGWHSGSAKVTLDATDAESTVEKTEYRVDGKAWKTGTTVWVKGQGKHRVAFRSTDSAGNVEATGTYRVRIDNRPPTTHALSAVSVNKGKWITVRYKVVDLTPRAKVKIRISGGASRTFNRGSQPTNKVLRLRFKLPPGQYSYAVLATDIAGNRALSRGSNSITVRKPYVPPVTWVYVTESGEKYHRLGCQYLWHSQFKISLTEAKANHTPCSVCNPPT